MKYAEKPLLITSTLLDNYAWLEKCPDSWKTRAFDGLKATLSRKSWTPTDAIKRGMNFESKINGLLNVPKATFLRVLENHPADNLGLFWDLCHGGEQQKTIKRTIVVEDQEYLLFGKTDIWFPSKIIDIKTTANFRGPKNYLDKSQHRMYAYIDAQPNFEYLVAVFDDDSGLCYDVQRIEVTVDLVEANHELTKRIRDTIGFIAQDGEMLEDYLHTFNKF